VEKKIHILSSLVSMVTWPVQKWLLRLQLSLAGVGSSVKIGLSHQYQQTPGDICMKISINILTHQAKKYIYIYNTNVRIDLKTQTHREFM